MGGVEGGERGGARVGSLEVFFFCLLPFTFLRLRIALNDVANVNEPLSQRRQPEPGG